MPIERVSKSSSPEAIKPIKKDQHPKRLINIISRLERQGFQVVT